MEIRIPPSGYEREKGTTYTQLDSIHIMRSRVLLVEEVVLDVMIGSPAVKIYRAG